MGLHAVLLMKNANSGEARLWLARVCLDYCRTNTEKTKIGKADSRSLLSIVKLYEEARRCGLLLLIWFACIVGCDYSSMPKIGPRIFCLAAGKMIYENLSSLFDDLVPTSKLTGDDIKIFKDRILAAEQMFLNGPVYDVTTNCVVQRSSRVHIPSLENPQQAYHLLTRWNAADPPFIPAIRDYEDPRKVPYFTRKPMHISTIPGAVLPAALEDCTKPVLETFLCTRNVGGISALKKEQLGALVKKKSEMEAAGVYNAVPHLADLRGISSILHAFVAGHVHATDVKFLNIYRSLPMENWYLWTKAHDRNYMKNTAAVTPKDVMHQFGDFTFEGSDEILHMNKAIEREGPSRAEDRLITDEAAATLSISSRDHTDPEYCVQHYRMAIAPSMKSEFHLTSVCVLARKSVHGRPVTTSIIGAHCSCLAGIAGRCTQTCVLLYVVNRIETLKIPSDELACTSIPCQWIIPTKGPIADVKTSVIVQPVFGKKTFDAGTLARTTSTRKTPSNYTSFSRGYIPSIEVLPWPAEEDEERFESFSTVYQKFFKIARLGPKKLITAAEVQFLDALGETSHTETNHTPP